MVLLIEETAARVERRSRISLPYRELPRHVSPSVVNFQPVPGAKKAIAAFPFRAIRSSCNKEPLDLS
ncbi:hypothetical protein [Spirulina sp. 06S082]|uniref:hypothetical protein n=1 Tax=Spirulina sp. 06S082 TaxID=3110248 RepID=UPI002B21FBDF|nr:hypothetical protein [Spirulina sp. 06S082]MEA5472572.1 hypothetical protein [Spirulina sp. 06S082]